MLSYADAMSINSSITRNMYRNIIIVTSACSKLVNLRHAFTNHNAFTI